MLLLDEPAAGMNPKETHEITELIGQLRTDGGYTILVIEHDMHVVEGISDRVSRSTTASRSPREPSTPWRPTRASSRRISARRRRRRNEALGPPARAAVDTYYGQIHILQSVDLEVGEGELVCLLGGNASGKSTTLKTILGIVSPAQRVGRASRARRSPSGRPRIGSRAGSRSCPRTGASSRR